MAAFLGVITTYSGMRWPGDLSTSEGIKFSDTPGGAISSWAALPTAAWFQIVLFVSFCEVYALKQFPDKAPGDVVPEGIPWPGIRTATTSGWAMARPSRLER